LGFSLTLCSDGGGAAPPPSLHDVGLNPNRVPVIVPECVELHGDSW
jgi:hypothetical protein